MSRFTAPRWIWSVQARYAAMIKQVDRAMGEEWRKRRITPQQALIVLGIGKSRLIAGEILRKGYFIGTNVTYNLNALRFAGLVNTIRDPRDRRCVVVMLTEDGLALHQHLCEKLHEDGDQYASTAI